MADLRTKIHGFIDHLFSPFIDFLEMAKDHLINANKITAHGLDVGQYLSIFGDMPVVWQLVIVSLMISVTVTGNILIFRSLMRIYYALKEAIPFI